MSTSTATAASVPDRGDRNRIRQSAIRARYDRPALDAVLDVCPIGHVSFVADDWPMSIPTAIARLDDHLYLHGSRSSRLYKALAAGDPVSVSVCRVDALVKARSAFHCSMNYRSAVIFGRAEPVTGKHKVELLDRFSEHLIPGSTDDFRPMLPKELKATELVRLPLDEYSVKIRDDDPVDDEEDLALPNWAGLIPLYEQVGAPRDAANLPAQTASPKPILTAMAERLAAQRVHRP